MTFGLLESNNMRRISCFTSSAQRKVAGVVSALGLLPIAVLTATPAVANPCDTMSGSSGARLSASDASSEVGSSTPFASQNPGQMPVFQGPTTALHLITGPGSPTRTDKAFQIGGTDLGIAFTDDQNHTYLAFGDTMSCYSADSGWRSNTLLRTTDQDFTDNLNVEEALTDNGFATSGYARQFIPSMKVAGVEQTTIPTSGVTVNGIHYVDYMSVRSWGAPGEWVTNYAATMSSPDGVNWTLVPDSVRPNTGIPAQLNMQSIFGDGAAYIAGNENLQMSAFVEDGDYVYRYSTPSGRNGSAILGRALKADFPKASAFEYFDGSGWVKDPGKAVPMLDGKVSQLSVAFHPGLNKWVALYTDGNGMVMRTADSLTGPWSDKRMLVDTNTIGDLYGGFILPHQSGTTLSFVATTWSAYNVILMKTDLTQVPAVTAASPAGAAYDPTTDDGLTVVDTINYAGQ